MHLRRSRRAFLGRAGGLGAALPFLRTLLPSEARAAGPRVRRLVLLMESNGTLLPRWRPTGSETSFTFPANSMLTPLEAHKDQLLLVDAMKIHHGFGDQHFRGYTALWTGVGAVGTNKEAPIPGGKSVDQHVGERIGQGRRLPTLNLGIVGGAQGHRNCFARGPQDPIGPESDPFAVYRRVFEPVLGTGGGAADALLAERKSVLDLMLPDLQALSGRLVGAEKAKIEAHLAAVRSLETSLSTPVGEACRGPQLDPGFSGKNAWMAKNPKYFDAATTMMEDTLLAALACDVTRVATLEWGASNNGQVYHWLGHTVDHHSMSHNPSTHEEGIVEINRWWAGRVARLITRLAAVQEDGGTMLDHTLIVWGNELGVGGPHKESDFPVLMAGGRNLGVKLGRWLRLPTQLPTNHLLVTICRAMGLDDDTYGDPNVARGPIPGAI